MTKQVCIVVLLVFWHFLGQAQIVNTGQTIAIGSNARLSFKGTYRHYSGRLINQGMLEVYGNWENKDPRSSVFEISSLPGIIGRTIFGGSNQLIGGDFKTVFCEAALAGNSTATLTSDIDVLKKLELGDGRLETDRYTLTILSPEPDAIQRAGGFIQTSAKGKLIRHTQAAGAYLFPLGTQSDYRPVEIEIPEAADNSFGLSLIPGSPSAEGYNTALKTDDIMEVFDGYFYLLNQETGTSGAAVRFYRNTLADRESDRLAVWNTTVGIWEPAVTSIKREAFPDNLNQFMSFSPGPPLRNLPVSYAVEPMKDVLTIFNAFTPDGDGKNDTWAIRGIDRYPDNHLTIFNRWGDPVFESEGYNNGKAWDGGAVGMGTYYYVLRVKIDGRNRVYRGSVTMMKK